jgi:hypothetical protein
MTQSENIQKMLEQQVINYNELLGIVKDISDPIEKIKMLDKISISIEKSISLLNSLFK